MKCCPCLARRLKLRMEMATPTKYPAAQDQNGVLLQLREDYAQAVLDLFGEDVEARRDVIATVFRGVQNHIASG